MNKFAKIVTPFALVGGMGAAALGFSSTAFAATGSEASDLLTAQCGDSEVKGKACHNVSRPSGYNTRSSVQGEVRESSRGQVLGGVSVVPGGFNAPGIVQTPWKWDNDDNAAGGLPRAASDKPGYGR